MFISQKADSLAFNHLKHDSVKGFLFHNIGPVVHITQMASPI